MSKFATIHDHISSDREALAMAMASGDTTKIGHLEWELEWLEQFRSHHPDDDHDPHPFELFCEAYPDADECRIYDV